MYMKVLGTPLLGIGLVAMLGGCGKGEEDTDKPITTPPDDDTAPERAAPQPQYMFWTGVWTGWDDAEDKPTSYVSGSTTQDPTLVVELWSQHVNPQAGVPESEKCYVIVDLSEGVPADWGKDDGFFLGIEVPPGADVTYNCPGWDFSTFGDPAEVFSTETWKIAIGGEILAEYKSELQIPQNEEHLVAGGRFQYGERIQDKVWTIALEVDENFNLVMDGQSAVNIDRFSMQSADGLVNGAYIVRSTWGWKLF